jgi:hypothetical protein
VWKSNSGGNSHASTRRKEFGAVVHTGAKGFVGMKGETCQALAGSAILRLVCLLPIMFLCAFEPAPMRSQDSPSGDLIGMSIEDLMKVDVDSVYGAAGYKQKLTEAPASVRCSQP